MRVVALAACVLSTFLAAPALSQQPSMRNDTGFYAGGAFGWSTADVDRTALENSLAAAGIGHTGVATDEEDAGWKGFVGYQFNRNFAVEAGYAYLGEFRARTTAMTLGGVPIVPTGLKAEVEAKDAYFVSGVAIYPLNDSFSVFGRLGLYSAKVEAREQFSGFFAKDRDENLLFGFGLSFGLSRNLSVRGEWERYVDVGSSNTGKSDLDVLSIGLVWKF